MEFTKFDPLHIPALVCAHPWRVAEIHQNRTNLETHARFLGNVLTWNCNGQPVSLHAFAAAYAAPISPRGQAHACGAQQCRRIMDAIAECDRYIAKEGTRAADLRPEQATQHLAFCHAHKAKLMALLAGGTPST